MIPCHQQVCRMTAKLLFERDCSFAWSSLVANEFVVDVLIPSVEAPVHHKEEAGVGLSPLPSRLLLGSFPTAPH